MRHETAHRRTEPPRIPLVSEPDERIADSLRVAIDKGTQVSSFAWTLAQSPAVCAAYRSLGGVFFTDSVLSARERELVTLRIAWNCRCEYVFGHHVKAAQALGLSDEAIGGLARPDPLKLADDELAIVRAVDELARTSQIGDSTWEGLPDGWTDPAIVEFLVLVGFYQTSSNFINAVRLQIESEEVPRWPSGARWDD
jgi:AhpD family alkylhydroperoxidase